MSKSALARGITALLNNDNRGINALLNDDSKGNPAPKKKSFLSLDDEVVPVNENPAVPSFVSLEDKQVEMTAEETENDSNVPLTSITIGRQTTWIKSDEIYDDQDFNVRYDMGDIISLSQSIVELGQKMPLLVDRRNEGGYYIRDGYRRMAAIRWLQKQGKGPEYVECFINSGMISEEERIAMMFITQDNKQLEPLEAAMCLKRLALKGWTNVKMAKSFGRSEAWARDLLLIAAEDPDIQELIKQKAVSYTAIVEANRAEPDPQLRKELILETVRQTGSFTTTDIRAEKAGKKEKKQKVNGCTDEEGAALFGPQIWMIQGLMEKYKKNKKKDETAAEIQSVLTIFEKDGINPVTIMQRLTRLEENEKLYFNPSIQQKITIITEYIRGKRPIEDLLDITD